MPPAKLKDLRVEGNVEGQYLELTWRGKQDEVVLNWNGRGLKWVWPTRDAFAFSFGHFQSLLAWPNVIYREQFGLDYSELLMWVEDGKFHALDRFDGLDLNPEDALPWVKVQSAVNKVLR